MSSYSIIETVFVIFYPYEHLLEVARRQWHLYTSHTATCAVLAVEISDVLGLVSELSSRLAR